LQYSEFLGFYQLIDKLIKKKINADLISLTCLFHSWRNTRFVTRVTRRLPLAVQELFSFPEHLSSPLVFNGAHVARSSVFCVVVCRLLFLSFCFFSLCPLSCLPFFDLRFLITALVSSNFFHDTFCTYDWLIDWMLFKQYKSIIWIRHSLQASIPSTHRHVHVQIVVLGSFLHYSWFLFFVLQFDLPS
jgi:hypothetical protein